MKADRRIETEWRWNGTGGHTGAAPTRSVPDYEHISITYRDVGIRIIRGTKHA